MEQDDLKNSIQKNSPGGEFLQSAEWLKFQEAAGHRTFDISSSPSPGTSCHPLPQAGEGDIFFKSGIVEHRLPLVGKYFYIPRGPVFSAKAEKISNDQIFKQIQELISLAKDNNAGWIRIEPGNSHLLDIIRADLQIVKAPHDMQPKEIFIIDITKPEEQLMAEMKSKTRYNIKLAQKKEVSVQVISISSNKNTNYVKEFLRLNKIMAKRQGIATHPDEYYRKMFETIPGDILKLYVAEYQGKVIAVNVMVFYDKTAIYLHGASDDKFRNVMAPYLLQWQAMQDAKKAGCERYDFGGISTNYESSTNIRITNKWKGITRFKLSFSPGTRPVKFPGSFDIIINKKKYWSYRLMQKVKNWLK